MKRAALAPPSPAATGRGFLGDGLGNPITCGLLLALAAGAVFSNSLGGQFLFDDTDSILKNPSIRHLWPVWQALAPPHISGWTVDGRPVLNLSLALNYAISGTNAWSYHALNLLIHTLASLTLFGIVRRTLSGKGGAQPKAIPALPPTLVAFAVALLWTVHPLQTEAVTYVIQRGESLMGLWYLLTLYGFIRFASERNLAWAGVSLVSCLLGMGTKEVMVTAPVMVFMYDRTFAAGSFREAWRRRWPYYLCLAATWALLIGELIGTGFNRSGSKGFGTGISWWAWERSQFQAIVHYLQLAIWPHPLIFNYGPIWISPAEAAPYALVVAMLAVAALWALMRRPAVGFLGFWFFGILAVTSLPPGNGDMITERRMYLPLAAVLALVVPAFLARAGRRGLLVCVGLAAVLSGAAWKRNRDYRDEFAIWSATAADRPTNPYAQYMMGVLYFNQGKVAEEFARYREALRLMPDFFEAHHSFANALFKAGDSAEAIAQFEAALAIKPGDAQTHGDFGTVLYQLGRTPDAIAQFEAALQLNAAFPEAHDNLGVALAHIGRAPEAIAEFHAALQLDPQLLHAHVNLASALAGENRLPEAAAEFEAALRIDPNFEAAHFFLGNVLSQEGRFAEAIGQYEATLRLNPNQADAHHNLGAVLAQLGRNAESKAQLEMADRLAAPPR